jgi:protein CMS1
MSMGVGTPQRINDLLEDGALSAKHLKRIIVDASYIDQKKRGILDMKETELPLVKLLTRKDLRERYEDEEMATKLLFF